VQAWPSVSSKPLLANAEISACRMLSFDNYIDVAIPITSSINLRKSSSSRSTPAIGCRMQCIAMFANETESLTSVIIPLLLRVQLVPILGDNVVQTNFVQMPQIANASIVDSVTCFEFFKYLELHIISWKIENLSNFCREVEFSLGRFTRSRTHSR